MAFNIKKAKEIQKKYPNKKWTECVKEAGVIGAVKKKPARVGSAKKKKTATVIKVKTIGAVKRVTPKQKIRSDIAVLERLYKTLKTKTQKNNLARLINDLHDKLDNLK